MGVVIKNINWCLNISLGYFNNAFEVNADTALTKYQFNIPRQRLISLIGFEQKI